MFAKTNKKYNFVTFRSTVVGRRGCPQDYIGFAPIYMVSAPEGLAIHTELVSSRADCPFTFTMTTMAALETILKMKRPELENDVWMGYVGMPCPDPEFHELVGVCPDCDNKFYEFQGKDLPVLGALMRLACDVGLC